jgi:DNA polymerase III alpha subunit (gram-positive type)
LELFQAAIRDLKRELIIQLEANVLTSKKGERIQYYAVNRWDENDEFDEWAKPLEALSSEAERILGVTNAQLECCRSTDAALEDFRSFLKK